MISIDKVNPILKLGKIIKVTRNNNGLSAIELSNKARISRSELHKIESGKANPSIFIIYKIVKALDLNLSDLLRKANI